MIGRITKDCPEAQPPLAEKGTGAPTSNSHTNNTIARKFPEIRASRKTYDASQSTVGDREPGIDGLIRQIPVELRSQLN